ncbi:MAG: AraC family transcriptional regulator [Limisphaerales bacterium]|jgi:AraC family transcriptional regulator
MAQEPKFVSLKQTLLVGRCLEMSRMQDRTPDLWRSFMPDRNTVSARSGDGFISMQVYPQGPDQVADPQATFTKWAVVEVENFDTATEGTQTYTLQGGEYAVFEHNGPATDMSTVLYIFQQWLPNSEFELDDREHFERLPEDYSPMDPDAREEFWIPVKPR